jgi:hypothetical protein
MPSASNPSAEPRWQAVVDTLKTHFHEPDLEAARVLYSAVAAHDLNGQPVWPMAVAPPGSLKSELVTALDGLERVYLIDNVTPKTFISGQIVEESPRRSPSLLHRIGNSGIILCPDFSTVLAMKADERNAVMADLRKIFDGKLAKEFGTTDVVPPWEGRITFVAAVTPAIDKFYSVAQSLGERFVMIRWHRAGPDAARVAMRQDINAARTDLKAAVKTLLESSSTKTIEMPKSIEDQIVDLAELVVRARTSVERDSSKNVISQPEPESATRLAQQLAQLAKGSACIAGRPEISSLDYGVARRAGLDCIPPLRRAVLKMLRTGEPCDVPASTKTYATDDLQLVGLVEPAGGKNCLSPLAIGLLDRIEANMSDQSNVAFTECLSLPIDEKVNVVGETSGEIAKAGAL